MDKERVAKDTRTHLERIDAYVCTSYDHTKPARYKPEAQSIIQESSISEMSESPYKLMDEKQLIFKVFDKHNEAMSDRKKKQAYMHKQGFIRGVLNDKKLVWEMRNIS